MNINSNNFTIYFKGDIVVKWSPWFCSEIESTFYVYLPLILHHFVTMNGLADKWPGNGQSFTSRPSTISHLLIMIHSYRTSLYSHRCSPQLLHLTNSHHTSILSSHFSTVIALDYSHRISSQSSHFTTIIAPHYSHLISPQSSLITASYHTRPWSPHNRISTHLPNFDILQLSILLTALWSSYHTSRQLSHHHDYLVWYLTVKYLHMLPPLVNYSLIYIGT